MADHNTGKPRAIKDGIYFVGAVDWDRRLFDALIPLPDGTSYNAYLVKGAEKIALIDTVDPPMKDVLFRNLDELVITHLDYVIFNHAEPDHGGSSVEVLAKYPQAKAVVTPRCKGMLIDRYGIAGDRFITVADGEAIYLGGRTLEFIHAPWVHWPETMLTYLKEDEILFPCDLFGAHLATSDLFVTDYGQVYEAAKRYYAEIMMPFRTQIQKHLERLKNYKIAVIAPSHGPVHDKPEFIMSAYRDWTGDRPKNIVVVPYISMHGITRRMVAHLVEALSRQGVTVKQFDLAVSDIGKLAMALVDCGTIVIGTPTVLTGLHPVVAYAAILANALKPKVRFASVIGSYGWGGRAIEQLTGMLSNLKVEMLPPVYCQGAPKEADLKALDELAATIARKHREHGLS